MSCNSSEVKLQGASYENPESGFMTFSISLFPQSLKISDQESLIVYVNTARNKNTSMYLGGSQIWLQVSEDVGQHRASYSACRFVHALGFFFCWF